MRYTKLVTGLLLLTVISLNLLVHYGCANIVPPGGGPRDSLPPKLVNAVPADSALKVTNGKIVLNFNEFVELKNASEKILISPYPAKQPDVEHRLRTVTVKLKDSLLPNTTYVVDLGDAIADLNEGNAIKNFRITFSTGTSIDNNELEGTVVLAETGATDSTMFALLYTKAEDSTVAKEKPRYVARIDTKGRFRFTNLPAGTFYVYALGDADGNKQYNQPIETFAFLDSAVVVGTDTKPVQLLAYAAEKERKRETSRSGATPKTELVKSLAYSANLENGAQDLTDSLRLSYAKPIRLLDTSKLALFQDSSNRINRFTVFNDSANKSLIIYTSWQPGSKYALFLQEGYAKDTNGLTNAKPDTLQFRAKTEKEYGSVRLRFRNLDTAKQPVLLLYRNRELVGSYPLSSTEWYRKLFKPGDYEISLLFDRNRNGRWDPGDYFSKPRKQPERVLALGARITVKPNWDNELQITLPAN